MLELYWLSRNLWRKDVFRWLLMVSLAALAGIAAGHTVIASVSGSVSVVDGTSMEPTYEPGARIYTAPISGPLLRGDIVLVDDGNKEYAVKRIVGLPGETLEIWRGYVFINRKMLIEGYLPKYTFTFPDERNQRSVFKLRPGEYFVLGDNRPSSADSREYGPIKRESIKSRVPLPETTLRATFGDFALPAPGKRTIRAL